jgi:serine/threonine protein kinase
VVREGVDADQQLLGGRYRLLEVLAASGTGTVWLGDDLRLRRLVAVKVLDPAMVAEPGTAQRLGREARTLSLLVHPNIVTVHGFDVDGDTAYLVMDLVEGSNLATALAQGPLPVGEAIEVGIQVCHALAAAHAAGVRHGNLKPPSLTLAPDGVVKVGDFGLGTTTDPRDDLYALGGLLYAMLTGSPPVPRLDLPADVPAGLDRLIDELLAPDPDDGPESAEVVRVRLEGILERFALADATATTLLPELPAGDGDPSDEPATPHSPGHRRASRWDALRGSPARWSIAAVLVLVLLAVVYATWPSGGPGAAGPAQWAGSGPSPAPGTPDDTAPSQPDAPPPATGTAKPSRSAPTTRQVPAADQIAALQTLVTQQADAGHLDGRSADELHSTLDDIGRRVSRGQTGAAAARAGQLRSRLTELNQLGKLTTAGYQVLAPAVDQLVSSLHTQ